METNEQTVLALDRYTPRFENQLQMYRASQNRGVLVLMIVFTAILLHLSPLLLWMRMRDIMETGESFFAGPYPAIIAVLTLLYIALLILRLLLPRRFAKKRMRALHELYGDNLLEVTITFFEDSLLAQSGEKDEGFRLHYAVFTHVTETRDLFVLKTREKHLILVEKQGLSGVDVPGFRALIGEKCPAAGQKRRPAHG
ncbi:MAG: YcxB family protein [Clostridia bacterium]|nr:YcxB family protein [Clostridia bacterium]